MCKIMHIAFFVASHTLAKFQALPKLVTQYFLSKIFLYFVGMIFFCTFASLNQNNYYKKY